jgi:hypothetical protein
MTLATRTVPTLAFSLLIASVALAQGNDNCALAVPQSLSVGGSITLSGNNSTATATNDFVVGSIYAGSPVYWVKFTTTQCANVSIAFCGQSPAWVGPFDVLASTCPGDVLVHASTSNTTDCGDGNVTFFYNLLPAGTWAFAVLNNPGAGMSGPFNLTVSATACAQNNDLCSDLAPQALASGNSLTFSADNSGATSLNDFDASSPYFGSPVFWHAFTTDACNTVTVNYCAQNPAWTNVFQVLFTDCPGLQTVQPSGGNTTDCGNGNATFYFNELPAGTYYLPVLADGGSGSIGAYTISVSAVGCSSDLCANAAPVPLASGATLTFSANNSTATSLNDFDASSPYFGSPVYWHAFTTDACNTVTVNYCGQNPAWTNVFQVLFTDCPGLQTVQPSSGDYTTCGNGNATFVFNSLGAGTYYIPVLADGVSGSIGAYTINVAAVACPVSYDLCASVADQTLASGGTLVFAANNAGAGSTDDWVAGSPYLGSPVNWHRFTTATCMDVTVHYCSTSPGWNNSFGFLANSCPADVLTYFFSSNLTSCGNGNVTYIFNDLPAGTWYLPVLNDAANGASGPYTITVFSQECNIGLDEAATLDWSIFPNPSEGGFSLMYGGASVTATIELLDLIGRKVHSERAFLTTGSVHAVNTHSKLAAGNYELRLTTPKGTAARRVTVR